MIPALRHQSILDSLRSHGGLSVAELADVLQVSPSTIRRDLSMLESEGTLHRTFGGAMLAGELDEPLDQVQLANTTAKDAIAAAAAGLVTDGMAVILDVGTSTLALAQRLLGRNLTIITASIPVFRLFADDPGSRLILLGGVFRADYQCTSGHMTAEALREVHADIAFLGCSGVSPDATIRDTTLDQVTVKRTILACADQTVLLADATKFPGKGSYSVASATTLTRLVTDLADLGPLAEPLASSGTEVIHA